MRCGKIELMISNRKIQATGGFTLVEVLVTVSITAMLTSVLVLYSRTGERQILLFREQSKVINLIARSKSLALQTYIDGTSSCGYGIHFSLPDTMILFRDLSADCANSDNIYSGPGEDFSHLILSSGIVFSATEINDILFIPPDPTVKLNPDQVSGIITLQTADGGTSARIKLNNSGQISVN